MVNSGSKFAALTRITCSVRPMATSGERACPAMHAIESQPYEIVCRSEREREQPAAQQLADHNAAIVDVDVAAVSE